MRGCSIVYQNGDREFYTDSPTIIQISIWCFARKIRKLRIFDTTFCICGVPTTENLILSGHRIRQYVTSVLDELYDALVAVSSHANVFILQK